MRELLYFIVGFVAVFTMFCFVFFTLDFSTLDNMERFGMIFFSVFGGTVSVSIAYSK